MGIVSVDGLDLDCVEEGGESVDCYSLDGTVLLVVAEVDTWCLVRCE